MALYSIGSSKKYVSVTRFFLTEGHFLKKMSKYFYITEITLKLKKGKVPNPVFTVTLQMVASSHFTLTYGIGSALTI